jgi:hypothetical protein
MQGVLMMLTPEECEYLEDRLEAMLKSALAEERQTHTAGYREQVVHDEALISGLLRKLERSRCLNAIST